MRNYKPTNSSLRHVLLVKHPTQVIIGSHPFKHLSIKYLNRAGRNNVGRISVFHRGGGTKAIHRIIDFKRSYYGLPAEIINIEYDPGRSAFIALLLYKNGFFSYILSPFQLNIGSTVYSSINIRMEMNDVGNHGLLANIPPGTIICNLENTPDAGGTLLRAAGCFGMLLRKENMKYSVVRLKSGEKRYINSTCCATIGAVSNFEHRYIKLGKAGRSRWLGNRSVVRGVAMNPVDHPHGGDTSSGKVHKTPWSIPTKGKSTRKKLNRYLATF